MLSPGNQILSLILIDAASPMQSDSLAYSYGQTGLEQAGRFNIKASD
jgi:hypothetical protein